jgi:hypothetical protein
MASVTLAESAKLSQDLLVAGIIENVVTVDRMYELLPFDEVDGNALAYNRENVLGNAVVTEVGDLIASDGENPIDASTDGTAPATFTQVTSSLVTIVGDAFVNGLIQESRSNVQDQTVAQVASKSKTVGRIFRHMFINGTGANGQFTGLSGLVAASQHVATGASGGPLSFAFLDEGIDLIKDKDGDVDYILMHSRTHRSYLALLRGLGGAAINEVATLPSGAEVSAYRKIPIFVNDNIPTNVTKGGSNNTTSVYFGTLDDGSRSMGISGLSVMGAAGIRVVPVGESESRDETITRVKWYCGLANFSQLGLAEADGITN